MRINIQEIEQRERVIKEERRRKELLKTDSLSMVFQTLCFILFFFLVFSVLF